MKKRVPSFLLAACMVISMALLTTGCSPKAGVSALWDAGKTRDKIVVISDIHIGIDDSYAETVKTVRC